MKKLNSDEKRVIIDRMTKKLWSFRFDDEANRGCENYFLEEFMESYTGHFFPKLVKWIEEILEKSGKDRSYGDIDYSISILKNEEKKKVLYISDHSTCADESKFLIIWDINALEEKIHFRTVWDDDVTDYKKGNKYVHMPNLSWYKKRGLSLDYVEKWHTTALGGSYADCRDAGYILTAERYRFENVFDIHFGKKWRFDGVLGTFHKIQFVARELSEAIFELNEK